MPPLSEGDLLRGYRKLRGAKINIRGVRKTPDAELLLEMTSPGPGRPIHHCTQCKLVEIPDARPDKKCYFCRKVLVS